MKKPATTTLAAIAATAAAATKRRVSKENDIIVWLALSVRATGCGSTHIDAIRRRGP